MARAGGEPREIRRGSASKYPASGRTKPADGRTAATPGANESERSSVISGFTLRLATASDIEQLGGGSDCGWLIYRGGILLGWGDDYGTVSHPDHELPDATREAAEALVAAASNLLVELSESGGPATPRPKPSTFPRYRMVINGNAEWLPLARAGIAYDSGWVAVQIGGQVMEEDGSIRDILPAERTKISDIADDWSASK